MLRFHLRNLSLLCVAGGRSCEGFVRLFYREIVSKTLDPNTSSNSDPIASFLRNSCGLSPSAALTAAKKANLKIAAKDDSVVHLLKDYGFDGAQIAIVAVKFPSLFFNSHPERSIRPKLEFFLAAGFSRAFLIKLLCKDPQIIKCSIQRRLSPNIDLVRFILGGDIQAVTSAIMGSTWILRRNPEMQILPNLKTLRQHGVTHDNVARIFLWYPRLVTQEPARFSKSVAFLKQIGPDPWKSTFVPALNVTCGLTQATWERKIQLYQSLGWSLEETISAFKRSPMCMLHSEEKVRKIMGFFTENLKWGPAFLASRPTLLSLSFEKRIVPRYAVFSRLEKMGITGKNFSFSNVLISSESTFLKKYVFNYKDQAQELLQAYNDKLKLTAFQVDV
ncbi:hypothetical protein HPP92_009519 [Vanilla planifolia]|uniref:Uncharacterized protein n=1 Tax=Vanilla planifolia TaxID=51239 RepID=A0A835REF1_VANPL|nr:hypothetical protein HPP92_009724 [Vanilla planifolia]KAG0487424.1 hypothetical protein HPP92_009519 [Vanilla planifolia]